MGIVDKKWQVYLAGKMGGLSFEEMNNWRKDAKAKLLSLSSYTGYKCSVINPVDFYNFEKVEYQNKEEVMDYDLFHVENSDFLIVNANGLTDSIGTVIEVYNAWTHKIPVFVFGKYENEHPWITRCITRFEPDIESIIKYLRDFYFV